MNRRQTGEQYEEYAAHYLEQRGYRILERNFRTRRGEIDLIALDESGEEAYLVFLEVKYRKDGQMGTGGEAVDFRKQQRIIRCAEYYLLCHPDRQELPCRFDVVSVEGKKITLIRDAFWRP